MTWSAVPFVRWHDAVTPEWIRNCCSYEYGLNTRFSVAIHILTLLAVFPAEALTSAFISGSVQTHPVVIRRILGRLRAAGFVKAMQGPGGGFALAVDPGSLTLRQVYEQLADRTVIAVHGSTNPECPVARNIGALLGDVISGAEQAMLDSFEDITIAGLAGRVAKREKAC